MIETDHKPLVPLLGKSNLTTFPQESYDSGYAWQDSTTISTMYQETFYTADTPSRVPSLSDNSDTRLQDEVEMTMELCVTSLPASTQTLSDYLKTQEEDKMCTSVSIYCLKGWQERKSEIVTEPRPYWNACSKLTVDKNGLLLYQK